MDGWMVVKEKCGPVGGRTLFVVWSSRWEDIVRSVIKSVGEIDAVVTSRKDKSVPINSSHVDEEPLP